jgi:hypothetical protein
MPFSVRTSVVDVATRITGQSAGVNTKFRALEIFITSSIGETGLVLTSTLAVWVQLCLIDYF